GTTRLAGASLSERLTHNSAHTEIAPAAKKRPRLLHVGVTQPIGAIKRPNSRPLTNCAEASTISGVARNSRVVRSEQEKERLPASAIIAGQLTDCAEGRSATSTPANPTRIALQRRQPTCSRRKIADSAVTKIGVAR